MSEQELSDAQRADLYLSRATRLQAVVDTLRQDSARNLETAELAVQKGVALEHQLATVLEALREWRDKVQQEILAALVDDMKKLRDEQLRDRLDRILPTEESE